MNNKVDFFQKKLSNSRSFVKQKRNSRTWIWICFIVLFLLVLWIFWRKLFLAPVNLDWDINLEEQQFNFSLWEEIYLQWDISANWDIITHTHTVNDPTYGIVRIKSDLINLYDYAGFVELTGIVEKFYQKNPIVKVLDLSGSLLGVNESDTNIVLDEKSGEYILEAWIQFLPTFFDEYVLLNEW